MMVASAQKKTKKMPELEGGNLSASQRRDADALLEEFAELFDAPRGPSDQIQAQVIKLNQLS
jgi:hypothetical protein